MPCAIAPKHDLRLGGVGNRAGRVGQHAHRAPAVLHPTDEDLSVGTRVVLVETGGRRVVDGLKLADALEPVDVGADRLAVNKLRNHLRIAGWAQVIDQVLRGGAGWMIYDPLALS
jgi:hypothetical protein